MDVRDEILMGLNRLVDGRMKVAVFPATVKAVNESDGSCDVEDAQGLELYNVRLRAALDGQEGGLMIFPAVGAQVLIGNVGNSPNEFFVIQSSLVTKVRVKVNNVEYTITNSGHLISVGGLSLKTVLDALVDQIKLITVNVSGVPSTVPVNAAAFDAIKSQLNTILE